MVGDCSGITLDSEGAHTGVQVRTTRIQALLIIVSNLNRDEGLYVVDDGSLGYQS